MTFHLTQNDRARWHFAKGAIVFTTIIAVCFMPMIAGPHGLRQQTEVDKGCGGLHAGIRAEVVRNDPNGSRPTLVFVTLVLLNDGDVPVNLTEGTFVIDGEVLSNNFRTGGFGLSVRLNPGESSEFARQLPISEYFQDLGEHTISWRGERFQSSTIKVKIPPE